MLLTFSTLKLLFHVVTIKFIKNFWIDFLQKTKFSVQLNTQKTKMNTKKLLVSFVAIASVLVLIATANAAELANQATVEVEVDGINAYADDVAVIAGETIVVRVEFEALQNDSDVTIEAELEGEKVNEDAISKPFDVKNGSKYAKILTIKVPYELKDDVNDVLTLSLTIDGKGHKTELININLNVQRPSYNADIKSVSVSQSVSAGESLPIDIVLKNRGYNNLDDLYVTVKITELGLQKTAYFGDLVAIESDTDDDDEQDTVSGRIYLNVPYDAKAGIYTVEIEVKNEDTVSKAGKQIIVENDFSSNVIATSSSKTVTSGTQAGYDLLIINPTNKLKVYKVITESSADLASSTDNTVVAIPAGSSKSVNVFASANKEGAYPFKVNVLSGENLAETLTLTLNVEGKSAVSSNPVVIITIVLAIIFLVLLVVLIVLLGKKPEKEGFGESYY